MNKKFFHRNGIAILLWIVLLTCTDYVIAQTNSAIPDPERFEQEIAAFTRWDAKNSAPEQSILFVGSSSIRMWDTADAFPDFYVINRGFGGSHISDLLHYFDRLIGRFDPALVVIYSGENDITAGIDPYLVFEHYTELLARIGQTFPGTDIVYISIKSSNSRLEHSGRFADFNQRIKGYNDTNSRLHYIDLAATLVNENDQPDDRYFVDDQLHLNTRGYELWNEKMGTFFENFEEGKLNRRQSE